MVYFPWDGRTLTESAQAKLEEFRSLIPANAKNVRIEITGWAQFAREKEVAKKLYDDERGSEAYNKKLSKDRAKAVREFLLDSGLVDADVSIAGQGWDGDGKKSRRAEVKISFES
jgi:outer membrane protein OmpA-like peptidoglycan-associated protein